MDFRRGLWVLPTGCSPKGPSLEEMPPHKEC